MEAAEPILRTLSRAESENFAFFRVSPLNRMQRFVVLDARDFEGYQMLKYERMKREDETRVYLWVTDFGPDASIVTKSIGLEPTYVQIAGRPNAQFPKMTNRIHCWEFHSPLSLDSHIDEHFDALLQLLEPHAAAIKTASLTFRAGINSAVYYYENFTPGIHLSEHAVKVIASMNISVDFDLYFIGDKE